MKKYSFLVAIFLLLINANVYAHERSDYIDNVHIYSSEIKLSKLTDNNYRTIELIKEGSTINIISETEIKHLYIIYSLDSSKGIIEYNGVEEKIGENMYLHELIELSSPSDEVTLTYSKDTQIKEIFCFEDDIPIWVEKWEPALNTVDLLLFSSHSDDEHIFFAGLIPHTLNAGKTVQVVYLTRHIKTPHRYDELLEGLWAVGIKNYPLFGPVLDSYSTTLDKAIENLKNDGLSLDDVIHFEVDMIRKFKPKVVVSHDEEGEYGHGQHRLTTYALEQSTKYLNDSEYESVYKPYEPYKIYLHLYAENTIVMDYDIPLEKYNGKTAFKVSMEGLSKHVSQMKPNWGKWLKYNTASEVPEYNPKYYGLFYSKVGYENIDNDMFYNIPYKPLSEYQHSLVNITTTHKNIKKTQSFSIDNIYIYISLLIIMFLVLIDLYIIIAKK